MNTNITISRLKHHEELSEETYCFTCNVLVDGKVKYTAKNTGHGAETQIEYAKPTTVRNHEELDGLVEIVDNLVHEAIMAKFKEKDMKTVARKLTKGLFFRVEGQDEGAYYSVKGSNPSDPEFRKKVLKDNKVELIINDLPINEAVNYFFKY